MSEAIDIPIAPPVIRIGEDLVNTETGEIVGLVSPNGAHIYFNVPADNRFRVTDQASADWVMEKRQRLQSRLDASIRRLAQIQANMAEEIGQLECDLQRFDNRFGAEMQEYAKAHINDKKRSLKTPFGTFGYRRTTGAIVVNVEMKAEAITWAKEHAPDAVKITESIVVTPLKDVASTLPVKLFTVTGPEDRFFMNTQSGDKL